MLELEFLKLDMIERLKKAEIDYSIAEIQNDVISKAIKAGVKNTYEVVINHIQHKINMAKISIEVNDVIED